MAKHHRVGGAESGKPPRISYLPSQSSSQQMPPEVMSVDESDTLLEEYDNVGEIISERRRNGGGTGDGSHPVTEPFVVNRRLVGPAVTIVEMSDIGTPGCDKLQQPLLTPLAGQSPSQLGENNTANSTGKQLYVLLFSSYFE